MRSVRRISLLGVIAVLVTLAACVPPGADPSPFNGVAGSLLAHRPFKPTDPSMFTPPLYGGPPLVTAPGPGMTEARIRADLVAFLTARFGPFSPRPAEGMALLDDAALIAKVPDLTLRAGLVSLLGTPGEPALVAYRTDPRVDHVEFGDLAPGIWAQSISFEDRDAYFIRIGSKLRYENYLEFGPLLMHEVLHSDRLDSYEEELTNWRLQILVRLDTLALRPEVASAGAPFTRIQNDFTLALLNSAVDSRLRVYESHGPIFPGSLCTGCTDLRTFSEVFTAEIYGNPTPGNPLLDQILTNLAEPGNAWTPGGNFGDALTFLDHNHRGYGPTKQLLAALALKLDVLGALFQPAA